MESKGRERKRGLRLGLGLVGLGECDSSKAICFHFIFKATCTGCAASDWWKLAVKSQTPFAISIHPSYFDVIHRQQEKACFSFSSSSLSFMNSHYMHSIYNVNILFQNHIPFISSFTCLSPYFLNIYS